MCRIRFVVVAVVAAALALPAVAAAQVVDPFKDTFSINYFDNANTDAPDATVRITNPGTTFDPTAIPIEGPICAMIYVFRPDQQMAECCGCKLTHNALLKLSVNNDLTANPLTADPLTSGSIKIVSALPTDPTLAPAPPGSDPECNPALSAAPYVPTPALRAWATHWQDAPNIGTYLITETRFEDATLSDLEYQLLLLNCEFIAGQTIGPGLGSGKGLCTCPEEGT